MKTINLVALIFLSFSLQAQNYRMTDGNRKALINISPEVYNAIYKVESNLNRNASKIKQNDFELYSPYINLITDAFQSYKLTSSQINRITAIICLRCYDDEWNHQLALKSTFLQNRKQLADSLEQLRIKEYSATQSTKVDERSKTTSAEKDKPYDLLQRSLYAFSNTNRNIAVFRGMDYNYSAPNLSGYLQNKMSLASRDFKISKAHVVETFIPKVSNGKEYLTVKYFVDKKSDIIGIYDSEEVMLINSVEISGSPTLIITLFLNYWPQKIKFDGYKEGEIAHQELLGDRISIIGITPALYKIVIDKGNVEVNYLQTYGINKKR